MNLHFQIAVILTSLAYSLASMVESCCGPPFMLVRVFPPWRVPLEPSNEVQSSFRCWSADGFPWMNLEIIGVSASISKAEKFCAFSNLFYRLSSTTQSSPRAYFPPFDLVSRYLAHISQVAPGLRSAKMPCRVLFWGVYFHTTMASC